MRCGTQPLETREEEGERECTIRVELGGEGATMAELSHVVARLSRRFTAGVERGSACRQSVLQLPTRGFLDWCQVTSQRHAHRDSNPRLVAWETSVFPICYFPAVRQCIARVPLATAPRQ